MVNPQPKDPVINESTSKNELDTGKIISSKTAVLKPEILSSGFIDIFNNGQVNASAQFIRLFISEPGNFAILISIYSVGST